MVLRWMNGEKVSGAANGGRRRAEEADSKFVSAAQPEKAAQMHQRVGVDEMRVRRRQGRYGTLS